jgi:hypothetical protein
MTTIKIYVNPNGAKYRLTTTGDMQAWITV